ncbi:alpha/beta fold hydrolase [Leptolyngbya sp. AN03gr2]|uniref:alpha/beta fold hydrolase n=1 Tax=unclassified Leptolyngbya TaxID=2650499 RepID=UPI003D31B04C
MTYIQVAPNVNLSIQDWGEGKTILFIPGWCYGHEMFEYQFTHLTASGYRCIGISMRGFGQSDQPWQGHNFDTYADDLRQVIDCLDLNDITLVGFSMGGAIALRYMGKHKQAKVAKFVLLSAATPCLTKKPDFTQGLDKTPYDDLIAACYRDRAAMNETFAKVTFHSAVSPAFLNSIVNMGMQASPIATIQCLEALRDADLRADLKTVTVSTLICHSRNDQVAPFEITAKVNHEGIQNSTLIEFENSGHGLFFDEKDKLNQELMKFIG